jgi:signal transduction histidine kinase
MPVAVTTSDAALSPVMSAGHAGTCAAHPAHTVQFYETEEFLYRAVAPFLEDGIRAHEPVLVIATDEHRAGFVRQLEAHGVDVEHARLKGLLNFVNANELLPSFMEGSKPDARRFHTEVTQILERLRGRKRNAPLRAYGEMVDLLAQAGNYRAAIRLEQLWNEVLERQSLSLLCAYRLDSFDSATQTEDFRDVCRTHGQVRPAERYGVLEEAARAREICMLQQRARSLAAEVERRKKLEAVLREALADRRQAVEALRTAEEAAERVKSEFLAVVSHELRTPLNTIMGYQDLLANGVSGPITPMQKQHLARIKSGASELLRLIDQMISRSRIEAGRHVLTSELVDVHAISIEASELAEPSAAEKGLALTFRGPNEPVYAATDPRKLKQILLGLLSNAIKFTQKGIVELSLSRVEDSLVFTVRDTGIGIAKSDLHRIFGPFVQVDASVSRQHGGIGLGLSLGRDLARLLGGDIAVESELGRGSEFTLRLPLD